MLRTQNAKFFVLDICVGNLNPGKPEFWDIFDLSFRGNLSFFSTLSFVENAQKISLSYVSTLLYGVIIAVALSLHKAVSPLDQALDEF